MKVLLTGASGFLGSNILEALVSHKNIDVTTVARNEIEFVCDSQAKSMDNLSEILGQQQVVIHAAGKAASGRSSAHSWMEYRRANVDLTVELARIAIESKVRRFIFISSIKIHGENTIEGSPLTEQSPHAPEDFYGLSKSIAEKKLQKLVHGTEMELVIIRPAMIYGRNTSGNMAKLAGLIDKGVPLPFKSIKNKRSLLAMDNAVDFILRCIEHPSASNEIFLIADGEDLSTSELVHALSFAMEKPCRLFWMPSMALKLVGLLIGKQSEIDRLVGFLQVDVSNARRLLGWMAPISVREGLERCFH